LAQEPSVNIEYIWVIMIAGEATAIAKNLIKEFEGLRLTQYKCSAGMPTIGYGHVIRKNERVASPITEAQAEALLDQDVKIAQSSLRCYCHVPLSPLQEAALISFTFNLGAGAFQASTLRQKLNRGEYILAADEFTKWVHAGGVKLRGLVRRRALERKLFLADIEINQQHRENEQHRRSVGIKYLPRQNKHDTKPISNIDIMAIVAVASVFVFMVRAKACIAASFRKLKVRVT